MERVAGLFVGMLAGLLLWGLLSFLDKIIFVVPARVGYLAQHPNPELLTNNRECLKIAG